MDFNHLPLTTEDGTQVNLDALYKIAPSCFTEARDEKTGVLRRMFDFKKLRQLLGDNAVEDEWDHTRNIYIEGDALDIYQKMCDISLPIV